MDAMNAYNELLLSGDVGRIRKLLARTDLFRRTLDVPGDIVECGVFKGTGWMLWLKLLAIYAPGSAKRVVGFDMFDQFPAGQTDQEQAAIDAYVAESAFAGVTVDSLYAQADAAGMREHAELVAGDIAITAPAYVSKYPGLRISLLHLDLDVAAPTLSALEAFYPRVVRGGLVVFDEYAIPRWSESEAVDAYFDRHNICLQAVPWANTPTAYFVKP